MGDLTGEVEGRHGRFRYFVNDAFIGASLAAYGEYSEAELTVLQHLFLPGATIIEAGANIGALTVPMARRAGPGGRVIAFEPQRGVRDLLQANLAANGITNTELHPVAVGAATGTARIPVPDYARVGNFGGVSLHDTGDEAGDEAVEVVRLDDVIDAPRVKMIKLDVEGMEQAALAGARRIISQDRPLLYVENHRGTGSAPLIRQVMDLGYRAYWDLPPLFNPKNFLGNARNLFPGIVSVNMVCVPAERDLDLGDPIAGPGDRPAPGL
ncbi:FkbM family methyltransferase [Rhodobacteraceae bacterium NNCM2]|nr:FkbM family methyltransferase [Coraliihabitans acroporae]